MLRDITEGKSITAERHLLEVSENYSRAPRSAMYVVFEKLS